MTSARDDLTKLAFSGLAPRTVDLLIERYGTVGGAVTAIESGRHETDAGVRAAVTASAESRRTELGEMGARLVFDDSADFPRRLDRLRSRPRWLFVVGELVDRPSVGIVGTRTCTRYGMDLARSYGEVSADLGWTVVSGLARGIDAGAHDGLLRGGGTGLAVFGSGIDVVYPRSNRALRDRLVEAGGAVASEFPPGTRPDRWRFPTRNRIIAGCSDILVVVEAGETGGALITARIAMENGIPVWATPGDVDRQASVGTNTLIRDGAFPIFGPDDLAAALDLVVPFAV